MSEIAAYLQQNPSVKVGIDGHTDPGGSDKYNQALSERRVNVIRNGRHGSPRTPDYVSREVASGCSADGCDGPPRMYAYDEGYVEIPAFISVGALGRVRE
jgi:hypothetical protein